MSVSNGTCRGRGSWREWISAHYGFLAISWILGALAVVLLASCGSTSPTVVRSGSDVSTTAVTKAPTTASPSTSSSTTMPRSKTQQVTIKPSTGLKSNQTVSVLATGFSPGEQLVVTECAAKGTETGPADCNLSGMQPVLADSSGKVAIDFKVVKGPFGGDNLVCSPGQGCLISVTQATPSPTEEADAPINFAG